MTLSNRIQWMESLQSEPYRLLFPMGIMLALLGIGVWIPFYFWPTSFPYPGQGHSVIQIQGFLLCFILGFLTTMLPKVLGVRPLRLLQFLIFPIGLILLSVCAWFRFQPAQIAVQGIHLVLIGNFLAFILRRWPQRKSSPPSSFVFIPMAIFADILGTAFKLWLLTHTTESWMIKAAALLQFQAFPLLLILGIGGFLLPKLFGNAVVDPQTLRNQPRSPIFIPLTMGGFFLFSFALEAYSSIGKNTQLLQLGFLLRTVVWLWFTLVQLRLFSIPGKLPAYLAAVRISLMSMGLGMAMPIFLPAYLIAWEHIIFISGFLWLTLSVAARVLSAHGGRLELLNQHRKKSIGYGILIFMGLASRVSTDIWTRGHWLHLACAAGFVLSAIGIWGRIYLPMLIWFPGKPR